MNKRKWMIALAVVCVASLIGVVIYQLKKEPDYKINTIQGSYAFDHDDYVYYLREVDYAFVGKIEENLGTEYIEEETMEEKETGTPYTKYQVSVSKIIKGDIEGGETLYVKKMGGLSKDKKEYYLCEEDNIPKEEEYYVFMAYAQKNGELLVAGKNSTIPTNEKNTTKTGKKIEKMWEKAEKLGDTSREHYKMKRKGKGEDV